MRHEVARVEQAAFWLHVAVALMLLIFMLCGRFPDLTGWLHAGEQILSVDFSATSMMSEVLQQTADTPSTPASAGSARASSASYWPTACYEEGS